MSWETRYRDEKRKHDATHAKLVNLGADSLVAAKTILELKRTILDQSRWIRVLQSKIEILNGADETEVNERLRATAEFADLPDDDAVLKWIAGLRKQYADLKFAFATGKPGESNN